MVHICKATIFFNWLWPPLTVIIKGKFRDFWSIRFVNKYKLGDEGKYTSLVKFKDKFQYEQYLDDIRCRKQRNYFTRLRLSCHKLKIETGRYTKPVTPRNERFCDFCLSLNLNCIDDELHFLLTCNNFHSEREQMLQHIFSIFPSTKKLSKENLFIFLMSSEGKLSQIISKFCFNNL